MVPYLYELADARRYLPRVLTSSQRTAITDIETDIQADPYRETIRTVGFSYKRYTLENNENCLYTRANKNGMIFEVFYRIKDDQVEIILIYFM